VQAQQARHRARAGKQGTGQGRGRTLAAFSLKTMKRGGRATRCDVATAEAARSREGEALKESDGTRANALRYY